MQDLLKKIIEMDEQAREIEQKAKEEKLRSEEEVEILREQIYNDYIVRAKDRIEKNIAVDQKHADERYAAYQEQCDDIKKNMEQLYEKQKDAWVDEIVTRTLA